MEGRSRDVEAVGFGKRKGYLGSIDGYESGEPEFECYVYQLSTIFGVVHIMAEYSVRASLFIIIPSQSPLPTAGSPAAGINSPHPTSASPP